LFIGKPLDWIETLRAIRSLSAPGHPTIGNTARI
jgi:hypothetical protein